MDKKTKGLSFRLKLSVILVVLAAGLGLFFFAASRGRGQNLSAWDRSQGAQQTQAAQPTQGAPQTRAAQSRPALIILHTNDSHGRAVADEAEGIVGFAAVAALKESYEAEGIPVLLLDAGDTFHGLPYAAMGKGENVLTLMNMAGYDAMTPGNHDFNYGSERLLELAESASFPVLSANVVSDLDGGNLFGATALLVRDGIRCGIFGLTTPELYEKTSPEKITGIGILDPAETAAACVKELKKQKADYIIGLMHMGTAPASEVTSASIAKAVDGIDLIVDGHSHSLFENGLSVNGTLIVSAGEWLKDIGVVTVKKDGTSAAKILTAAELKIRDPRVAAEAAGRQAKVDGLLDRVIGSAAVTLDGNRETVRAKESSLGDWAADVIKRVTGADLVFLSGGGIRASIGEGPVTQEELLTSFPFGNAVVVKRVTGKTILSALEHGLAETPELSGGFPQVAGIRVEYDSSLPPGGRVRSATVNGTPLSKNLVYLVAMTDHVAAGGDGYEMMTEGEAVREYDSMEDLLQEEILREVTFGAPADGRLTDLADQANLG